MMTKRITLRALEEVMDVTASVTRLQRRLELALADGVVCPVEQRELIADLQHVRREQREAARYAERADYHMEVIGGWTHENGPNEKTARRAEHHGYEDRLDDELERQPAIDTRESA